MRSDKDRADDPPKVRRTRDRTVIYRALLWALLGVVVAMAIVPKLLPATEQDLPEPPPESLKAFAQEFLHEYFSLTVGDDAAAQRLNAYVHPSLSADGGVVLANNSYAVQDIVIIGIEADGSEWLVDAAVRLITQATPTPEERAAGINTTPVEIGWRFLTVTIRGETGAGEWVVTEHPRLVPSRKLPGGARSGDAEFEPLTPSGDSCQLGDTCAEIEDAVERFVSAYYADDQGALDRLVTGDVSTRVLNFGNKDVPGVQSQIFVPEVADGETADTFVVKATVKVADALGTVWTHDYTLKVVLDNGKYFVSEVG